MAFWYVLYKGGNADIVAGYDVLDVYNIIADATDLIMIIKLDRDKIRQAFDEQ